MHNLALYYNFSKVTIGSKKCCEINGLSLHCGNRSFAKHEQPFRQRSTHIVVFRWVSLLLFWNSLNSWAFYSLWHWIFSPLVNNSAQNRDMSNQVTVMYQVNIIGCGVFTTHGEDVAMFLLHSIQELGGIFSKFKCVAQPGDHSFVQRGVTLGSKTNSNNKINQSANGSFTHNIQSHPQYHMIFQCTHFVCVYE